MNSMIIYHGNYQLFLIEVKIILKMNGNILYAIYLKNLTIGIMSIVFILLAIWIKGGLTSMKNKLKMD